jgi:hypothetical protein
MSFTQLSAGVLAALFSLTTIGSELVLMADKSNEKRLFARALVLKEKPRKDDKQSPWETRPMIPSGPKF